MKFGPQLYEVITSVRSVLQKKRNMIISFRDVGPVVAFSFFSKTISVVSQMFLHNMRLVCGGKKYMTSMVLNVAMFSVLLHFAFSIVWKNLLLFFLSHYFDGIEE